MFRIIFTRYNDGNQTGDSVEVCEVPSTDAADAKMMDMFVNFCRDVSKKPLTREHYANGFEWMYKGRKYSLHYISKEVS